jgi:hypothetical protein
VLPVAARHPRRNDRALRSIELERLEKRELLSYSPLGFSQPDLAVSGFGPPVAAWGGPLTVTVDVRNIGSSTIIEPLAQEPGAASTADAGPVGVSVFLIRGTSFRDRAIQIGTIGIDTLAQNSDVHLNETFVLPPQPPGFRNISGDLHLGFVVSSGGAVPNLNSTRRAYVDPTPVALAPALPELVAVGLDVPPVMQPGDTIQPNIQIANFGTVDSALFGPFTVFLLATTRRNSLKGASVIDSYTIEALPPLSRVPQTMPALGDVNINLPVNVDELEGRLVTLPVSPSRYFITVVVDPGSEIPQIHNLNKQFRKHGLVSTPRPVRQVGPPVHNLPPAGVVSEPSSPFTNPFPEPSFPVNSLSLPTSELATLNGAQSLSAFPNVIVSANHPTGPATF